MVNENYNLSPFSGSLLTLIFMFSTMYTLGYLYLVESNVAVSFGGLSDENADVSATLNKNSGFFSVIVSTIDLILEIISWISPIALIKNFLILSGIQDAIPMGYAFFNMLVLRPVGWIMSYFMLNYAISKIPTVSGES